MLASRQRSRGHRRSSTGCRRSCARPCSSRTRPASASSSARPDGGRLAGGRRASTTRCRASTEQILHPEKYAAGEAPVAVDLPDDLATRARRPAGRVPLEDTFGEFQLGDLAARGGRRRRRRPTAAAAGWGGDRLAVLDGPGRRVGGRHRRRRGTRAADAAEFADAAATAVDGAGGPGAGRCPATAARSRWIVIGIRRRDAAARLASVLGLAG